jgi:predicted nucleic acid-binding protein
MFFKHLVPTSDLLTDGMRLARELGHSVYDCLFLALAAILPEGRLLTADARFLGKVTGSRYENLLLPLASRSPTEK